MTVYRVLRVFNMGSIGVSRGEFVDEIEFVPGRAAKLVEMRYLEEAPAGQEATILSDPTTVSQEKRLAVEAAREEWLAERENDDYDYDQATAESEPAHVESEEEVLGTEPSADEDSGIVTEDLDEQGEPGEQVQDEGSTAAEVVEPQPAPAARRTQTKKK